MFACEKGRPGLSLLVKPVPPSSHGQGKLTLSSGLNPKLARVLIELGANPNVVDKANVSCMHKAALSGNAGE